MGAVTTLRLRKQEKGMVLEKANKNTCPGGGAAMRNCNHSDCGHGGIQLLSEPAGAESGSNNPPTSVSCCPPAPWHTQLEGRDESWMNVAYRGQLLRAQSKAEKCENGLRKS